MSKYLAIFDVRKVQDFIFKSKTVKEIIGASKLIEDLLAVQFKNVVLKYVEKDKFLSDWENEINNASIDNHLDNNLEVEIVYNGGGNLIALFSSRELFDKISKDLAVAVYENSYGVAIVSACVEATGEYKKDYDQLIGIELAKVKASALSYTPTLSYAITANDRYNGLPYESKYQGQKCSKEKALKLKVYEKAFIDKTSPDVVAKDFKDMITQEGENSNIAIMHIDGNGVGQAIKENMEQCLDYDTGIKRIRDLSKQLSTIFDEVDDEIYEHIKKRKGNEVFPSWYYMRRIILAGDDITYVCNSEMAIDIFRIFAEVIKDKSLENEDKNLSQLKLSVCGGIVICNVKFPFYQAYKYAEELCSKAKKYAKSEDAQKLNDGIGSYFDYEYIKGGYAESVDSMRKLNESYADKEVNLYRRPFGVGTNDVEHSFANFIKAFKNISNSAEIPRSWAKELRDSYVGPKVDLEEFAKKAESRGIDFKLPILDEKDNYATYYAPLDLMDIYSNTLFDNYMWFEKGKDTNE